MNRRRKIEGYRNSNLSKTFVLPMVGINHKDRDFPLNFINSYVTNDYHIIMVFDKTENYDETFYRFLSRMKSSRHLAGYEDLEDEAVIILSIPDFCKPDYDCFIEGKYSRFSESYKSVISMFFGKKTIKDGHTVTEYNTIYPEDFKRKQIAEYLSTEGSEIDYRDIKEVLHKPDLDKEMYTPLDVLLAHNIVREQNLNDGVYE